MRFIFICLMLTSFLNESCAQISQGSKMMGGNLDLDLSFDSDDDYTNFSFQPSFAYFLWDKVAVGANIGIDNQRVGESSTTEIFIGPFIRAYFLGGGDLKMFAQIEVAYANDVSKVDASRTSKNGFRFFGGPGVSYFLTDAVAVDVLLGYNYANFGSDVTSSNLRLLAGFQIFID